MWSLEKHEIGNRTPKSPSFISREKRNAERETKMELSEIKKGLKGTDMAKAKKEEHSGETSQQLFVSPVIRNA